MGSAKCGRLFGTTHRPPAPPGARAQRANPEKPFEPSGETAAPHPRFFFGPQTVSDSHQPVYRFGVRRPGCFGCTNVRLCAPTFPPWVTHSRHPTLLLRQRHTGSVLPDAPPAAILSPAAADSIAAFSESFVRPNIRTTSLRYRSVCTGRSSPVAPLSQGHRRGCRNSPCCQNSMVIFR